MHHDKERKDKDELINLLRKSLGREQHGWRVAGFREGFFIIVNVSKLGAGVTCDSVKSAKEELQAQQDQRKASRIRGHRQEYRQRIADEADEMKNNLQKADHATGEDDE